MYASVPTGAGATQEAVRRHNLATMLRQLHLSGNASRAELTTLMGLNRSTIAALATALGDLGLVRATGPTTRSGAGRPSAGLQADPMAAQVLGVDVGVDRIQVALVGLGGRVIDSRRVELWSAPEPGRVADVIGRLAVELIGQARRLVGVGLSVPGVVSRENGVVRVAPNLGWVDVAFAAMVRDRLPVDSPVTLANDADLGALAEHSRGAGRGTDHLVFISGDVGVGAGVISGGRPLGGADGFAGEAGHMSIDPGGPPCHCGNSGCWETLVGAAAIAAAIDLPRAEVPNLAEWLQRYDGPVDRLSDIAEQVGRGLGNLVNLLNPEVVILGGYLAALHELVGPKIIAGTQARALAAPRRQVRLCIPSLGRDAVLLGAAELAFVPLLDDPTAAVST